MTHVTSASTQRPYPAVAVCRVWKFSRATLYRHHAAANPAKPVHPLRRRGPQGACSDEELLAKIQAIITAAPFTGEGYRKVWARLRIQGIRTAARRVRRIMKENGLLAPQRPADRAKHPHDGTIMTDRVDQMWGTDMTQTVTTGEGRAYVFIAVDHCSGELVGTHASSSASRWEALEPIRQGVAKHFGAVEENAAVGLVLRHDHGSNYMSEDFQDEIEFLGIESSPAFVRQPEGNGVAERVIKTLKEQLLWIQYFTSVEELRKGLAEFAALYNDSWLRERHGHKTPNQIRVEQKALASEAATEFKWAA